MLSNSFKNMCGQKIYKLIERICFEFRIYLPFNVYFDSTLQNVSKKLFELNNFRPTNHPTELQLHMRFID